MRRVLAFAAGTLLLWGIGLADAVPAGASCALPPARSEHLFFGVVTQISANGRIAEVRRDDGRTVTVRGGETRSNAASSVDRQYETGVRYEFHPINAQDPYEDNACTATRRLDDNGSVAVPANGGAPAAGGVAPLSGDSAPESGNAAPQSGYPASEWVLPGMAALALAVAGGAATRRTRRRSRPRDFGAAQGPGED